MQPLPTHLTRVLAVGAHPDDAEFYAGATLAGLARAGAEVRVLVCTDGSRGGRGLEDAAGVRRREQGDAVQALGVAGAELLAFEDGRLENGEPLRRLLVEAIRRQRPELVLAHDPATLWQPVGDRVHPGHSDHRAAGQAALDAVYPRAPSENFYPDLDAKPWYPREVWLFDTARPDWLVEAAPAAFEAKLAALRAHTSQEAVAGGLVEAARALAGTLGGGAGLAEGFVRLRLW